MSNLNLVLVQNLQFKSFLILIKNCLFLFLVASNNFFLYFYVKKKYKNFNINDAITIYFIFKLFLCTHF